MLAFNAGIHMDRQIVLRLGINVGDIIIDGNDVFGDSVNVGNSLAIRTCFEGPRRAGMPEE